MWNKTQILFIACLCMYFNVNAQDFKKRYSFSKAYFGLDFNYIPNYGESFSLTPGNTLNAFNRNGLVAPAINFAASHFWNYTDIYVTIHTANVKFKKDAVSNKLSLGAIAGFRIYPMPLHEGRLRPFVGYKFAPVTYSQQQLGDQTHQFSKTKSIVDIGLGYKTPSLYMYAGYNRILNPGFETYVSRTQKAGTSLPSHFFNVGVNLSLETTRGANNAKTKQIHHLLDTTNTAGFFFGIGPSSVFPLVNSTYLSEDRPFLNNKEIVGILPELSLGYHFTKQDFIVATAFRPIRQTRSALNFEQKVRRNSLVLEGYKFLFDYHGFAPFVGGGASYEHIRVTETDNEQKTTDFKTSKITPILTFGWDIRPSRKSDAWLLRTNLRYAPILSTTINDKALSLQHLEFNYIQVVIYPGRIKLYRSK